MKTKKYMDSELDAGYLVQLFTEPLYLMGYGTEEKKPSPTVSTQKEEVKSIPMPSDLPTISQKISKKCILLFLSEEDELSAREAEFLKKVMLAVKVEAGEYECINFRGITIGDVVSRYAFDKLVLFGVKVPGLEIEQYVSTQVKSTKIISADDVWMVETNNGLKKQLWEQLQAMFGK